MVNRNARQIISEVETLLREEVGFTRDKIERIKASAYITARLGNNNLESYILALDRLIASEIGAVLAGLN